MKQIIFNDDNMIFRADISRDGTRVAIQRIKVFRGKEPTVIEMRLPIDSIKLLLSMMSQVMDNQSSEVEGGSKWEEEEEA